MNKQKPNYFKNYFNIIIVLLALFIASCKPDKNEDNNVVNTDILEKINALPGVNAIEIIPYYGYPRAFQIDITQLIDHNNPNSETFTQRIYLSHVDENMPMIFAPSGYAANEKSGQEIAGVLGTNCLNVTHRYFVNAKPEPLDWQYLTIEQSAADHHHIVNTFKEIYNDKWISSGVSKSGQTAVFHKGFYPDDVDATIAYVAPFVFGINDMRFEEYIENIGEDGCYEKLRLFQKRLLEYKTEFMAPFRNYLQTSELTFSMDEELLFELAVMDYHFAFWQYNSYDCSEIPDISVSITEQFNHLADVVWLDNFSDYYSDYFAPYVYQALTQNGAPGYKTEDLDELITEIDFSSGGNPNFELLAPEGATMNYSNTSINNIYNWLQTSGNNIIYIYGKNDPWSAGAIELTGETNAIKIMQEGGDHRTRIYDLDEASLVFETLEEWLGIEINNTTKSYNAVNDCFIKHRLN